MTISLRSMRDCIAALPHLTEAQRLRLLNRTDDAARIDQSINGRALIADLLKRHARNGMVSVEVWSRDCDGTSGTSLSRIPATLQSYRALWLREAEDAEGPFTLQIISPEQAQAFRASTQYPFL